MNAVIRKCEKSQLTRISKEYNNAFCITPNTPLSTENSSNSIIISKKFKHKNLEERVSESGIPLNFSNEIEWDHAVGSEVW